MSEWKAKRFWTDARVVTVAEGFTVELDGRPVKTPGKSLLVVPTKALADRIAVEWDAQEGEIDPRSMPFTRSANAAIDKVRVQKSEVAELIAAYGDADLLCYRADHPESLVTLQSDRWDPLLEWADDTFGARLVPVTGVIHVAQSSDALEQLTRRVKAMDAFALTAFHDLVSLSGSLVLGFAAICNHKSIETVWDLSRLDEDWQAEQWGEDEEAAETAAAKQSDFFHAKMFYDLAQYAREMGKKGDARR